MRAIVFDQEIEIDTEFIKEEKDEVRRQLEEYLAGRRSKFDLEVLFPESFTGRVMEEMEKINYGDTRTYGQLAKELDTSPIAVGQACGRNPVPVIVPCHRVVGKGAIGGYRYSADLKEKLLDFESGP